MPEGGRGGPALKDAQQKPDAIQQVQNAHLARFIYETFFEAPFGG
jgi:hypothetical protein